MILRDHDTNGDGTYDARHYVHHDANYNTTSLTDDAGDVVERFIYDPYGQPTVLDTNWSVDTSGSDFGWQHLHQGGRRDPITGLYHFRYRDYSAALGRWINPDPAGYIDGANLYQALRSSPLIHLDPNGLRSTGGGPTGIVTRVPAGFLPDSDALAEYMRNAPMDSFYIAPRRDWFDRLSNFAAGWGDTLTGNLTWHLRGTWGGNLTVDREDGDYQGGSWVGMLNSALLPGGAAGRLFEGAQRLGAALDGDLTSLLGGRGKPKASVGPTPNVSANAAPKGPVKPGQSGTYGDLKTQKKTFGETEALDMDHRPSYAAQKKALEDRLGRKLSDAEAQALKNSTPAVATPRGAHQQNSRTYGGRNTPEQIAEDAKDLDRARRLDDEAYRR